MSFSTALAPLVKNKVFWQFARCRGIKTLSWLDIRRMGQHLKTSLAEQINLRFHCRLDFVAAAAGVEDSNAASKVNLTPAFDIPDFSIFNTADKQFMALANAA